MEQKPQKTLEKKVYVQPTLEKRERLDEVICGPVLNTSTSRIQT